MQAFFDFGQPETGRECLRNKARHWQSEKQLIDYNPSKSHVRRQNLVNLG